MAKLRIPLYDVHRELGAQFGEFAGWEAPINYGSVIEEHLAVRQSLGFFDLSHMGRLVLSGADATRVLDYLVPRDISSEEGMMVGPTAMLNENAGFRDDIMPYNLGDDGWLIVPNAVNREKILSHIEEWIGRLKAAARVEDKTFDWVLFAVQGPRSAEFMKMMGAPSNVLELRAMRFLRNVELGAAKAKALIVSRSGWTGEDGFEIIAEVGEGEKILRKAAELLPRLNGKLCGLGARDSLRMEVGFVLYGHEIDETINPVEARYWWVFQPGPKEDCLGCKALREALRRGADRVRVGLRLGKKSRIVPRQGDKIYVEDVEIGYVTSGAYSPILRRSLAQAYIDARHALMGMSVMIERRGKLHKAKIIDFPAVTPSSHPPT